MDDELESLPDTIEQVIRQFGVKLICVDNLMTAMDVGVNDNLYQAQSAFVHKLKQIAVKYDVSVVLVAHPRKTKEGFTNDDVAGSGDITNRVDTVLAYSRNPDTVSYTHLHSFPPFIPFSVHNDSMRSYNSDIIVPP